MTDKTFESFERWWEGKDDKESDNEWKRAFDRMISEAIKNEEELNDEKD